MFDNITDVLNIAVYAIGCGFGYTMLFGLISWGVWVVVDLFRSVSHG